MADGNRELRASEFWLALFKAEARDDSPSGRGQEDVPFHAYLCALCRECGETPDGVLARAGVEERYGRAVFRGGCAPSRDTVLRLAFGLRADLELARELLARAGRSPLYARVRRDVVVCYCLSHASVGEAQDMLARRGLPPIEGETGA